MCCISLFFISNLQAQKITDKKQIIYADGTPLLKMVGGSQIEDNSPMRVVSHDSDKLLFVITKHTNRVNHTFYNEVTFADVEKGSESPYDFKPLIKSLLENEVLNTKGELNLDEIDQYIRLFGRKKS